MLSAVPSTTPSSAPVPPLAGGLSPAALAASRLAGEVATLSRAEAEAHLSAHRTGIHSFLRRKGFSAEEADDLTQETLIRAYTHLSGFRGAAMGAWLYRIAANVAVDHLRRQRLATVPLETVAIPDTDGTDLSDGLRRDERRKHVLGVIGQLPACHQRVLRMRFFEDRSLDEIAVELECSRMAAKLRVFRAVTALRKRWRSLALDVELLAG